MNKLAKFLITATAAVTTIIGCSKEVEIGTNVGNGEPYSYEITNINGDEIYGTAIDKISNDNRGIFLYADEVPFYVKPGDKIAVTWGEEEDQFAKIELK